MKLTASGGVRGGKDRKGFSQHPLPKNNNKQTNERTNERTPQQTNKQNKNKTKLRYMEKVKVVKIDAFLRILLQMKYVLTTIPHRHFWQTTNKFTFYHNLLLHPAT